MGYARLALFPLRLSLVLLLTLNLIALSRAAPLPAPVDFTFTIDGHPITIHPPGQPNGGGGGGGGKGKPTTTVNKNTQKPITTPKTTAVAPPTTHQEPSTPTPTPTPPTTPAPPPSTPTKSSAGAAGAASQTGHSSSSKKSSSVPAFPIGSLPAAGNLATNSADDFSSLSFPSTTSPSSSASAGALSGSSTSAKHTTLLAAILVPLVVILLLLVGAALYRRHKKKQEQSATAYPYPPMQDAARRGRGAALIWHRAGTHLPDFMGGAGSSQTGADVPRPRPTVGHGYSNSSLESLLHHRAHPRSWALQLVHKPLYEQPCVRAVIRKPLFLRNHHHLHASPRARAHALDLCYHGGGARVWVRLPRTDDGHSVFADSPFESESPLHWQDEPALAEAESRPTSMDVAPVPRYGAGSSNNEYGVGSGSGNASDGRASPVYGAEYAGYTRGARSSAVYDPDSVYDARGSTLLAYDRDSAFVYEPRR
ncbi:hypothetical protein B0H13DRAFT_2434983 [Mycena leptocephala]|nr:hypothetical protein B0H13DRAFT_2434983 [Mycena leptocephala]